jgi:hypothetical protein
MFLPILPYLLGVMQYLLILGFHVGTVRGDIVKRIRYLLVTSA